MTKLKPLTNPAAPHDAGRNTPAARNYTNARRAGRTRPDLIEFIDDADPRSPRFSWASRLASFFGSRR